MGRKEVIILIFGIILFYLIVNYSSASGSINYPNSTGNQAWMNETLGNGTLYDWLDCTSIAYTSNQLDTISQSIIILLLLI